MSNLENWVVEWPVVYGNVFGDSRWDDGEAILTSRIVRLDLDKKELQTMNTLYTLGKPA